MPDFSTLVDPHNALAIAAKLYQADKTYKKRRLTFEHIICSADYAEERLARLGLTSHPVAAAILPEPAPRGSGTATATAAVLQRVPYGWLLIAAARVPTRNLSKAASLRSRVQVFVGADEVTGTLTEVGRAMGIRFIETYDPSEVLREAARAALIFLP